MFIPQDSLRLKYIKIEQESSTSGKKNNEMRAPHLCSGYDIIGLRYRKFRELWS